MVDTESGEFTEKMLTHEGNAVRKFYAALEVGIEYRVGHPAKIRAKETRKQKHDRRDAGLLLELLVEDRFPEIWMPSSEQ